MRSRSGRPSRASRSRSARAKLDCGGPYWARAACAGADVISRPAALRLHVARRNSARTCIAIDLGIGAASRMRFAGIRRSVRQVLPPRDTLDYRCGEDLSKRAIPHRVWMRTHFVTWGCSACAERPRVSGTLLRKREAPLAGRVVLPCAGGRQSATLGLPPWFGIILSKGACKALDSAGLSIAKRARWG